MTYATIVADPPWPFQWQGGPGGRRRNQTDLGYVTMKYGEIAAFPVADRIESNATLFLWLTRDAMHEGHGATVARAWGFERRVGEFVWRKPNFGTGHFPRLGHETCAIYNHNKGSRKADAPRNIHSVQTWSQRYKTNSGKTHSAKPDGLMDLVERGHRGPYLELFARRQRLGWDYWGNEVESTVQIAGTA